MEFEPKLRRRLGVLTAHIHCDRDRYVAAGRQVDERSANQAETAWDAGHERILAHFEMSKGKAKELALFLDCTVLHYLRRVERCQSGVRARRPPGM